MHEDLIELSKTVDPAALGGRVRSARLRAGLTQAQVAGTEMSVGYVSRIESGQRRPDLDLLTVMAERLGVDVAELLVGIAPDRMVRLQVDLDHAELALVTGSPAAALEPLARILSDPDIESVPELRRRARYLQASGLELTGDVQGAILTHEDLAEAGPQDLEWLKGLTALSRCYRESGELGRAIEVGNQGARFIDAHGLAGLDESIRHTLNLAAAYVEQGDVGYATRMCRRVVERADETASTAAKGSAYWNLSIIESKHGNPDLALAMAQRALSILEVSQDARNTARLRTQLGMIQLRVDPPEPIEALELLDRAATELEITGAVAGDLVDNHLAQARARFLLGDHLAARAQAEQTVQQARSTTPSVAAAALALLGEIAIERHDTDAARAHFQEAVLVLSALGADRSAARLWFELGELLESVGDSPDALDAYRRAAAATGLVASTSRRVRAAARH
jgi:transcriptional regulator with XRE-family HTH domain